MSDTVLGAFIAGIAGVVTAVVGGGVKWFLDARAHRRECDYQRDKDYLEKRMSAYEGFITFYTSYLSFLNFVASSQEVNSSPEGQNSIRCLAERQTIFNDIFKNESNHLTAIRMYGSPCIYKKVAEFLKEYNEHFSKKDLSRTAAINELSKKLEEIAFDMRVEINNVLCRKEEIKV